MNENKQMNEKNIRTKKKTAQQYVNEKTDEQKK